MGEGRIDQFLENGKGRMDMVGKGGLIRLGEGRIDKVGRSEDL